MSFLITPRNNEYLKILFQHKNRRISKADEPKKRFIFETNTNGRRRDAQNI